MKQELMGMAEQAGFFTKYNVAYSPVQEDHELTPFLETFAKLVAAAEREAYCVGWFGYDTGLRLWFEANKGDDGAIPLYKDLPPRPWVGLTEEERVTISYTVNGDEYEAMRLAEAKLEEKNLG